MALLYRAIPNRYQKTPQGLTGEYISYLGLALSDDGVHFRKQSEPVFRPGETFDRFGVEDPRTVRIPELGKDYLVTYTALSEDLTTRPDFDRCVRLALATTPDLRNFTRRGIIGPPTMDKDGVIFPHLFNGRIALLHRIPPNIQLAWFDSFDDLLKPPADYWQEHMAKLDEHVIMRPEFDWECSKIGAGPTPIKTKAGWLMLHHGVDEKFFYRGGAALLDLDDPSRVVARCPHPILEPTDAFETNGDVPNVVFPQGAVVINGLLHVYYGGGDTCICLATCELDELVNYLLKFKVTK